MTIPNLPSPFLTCADSGGRAVLEQAGRSRGRRHAADSQGGRKRRVGQAGAGEPAGKYRTACLPAWRLSTAPLDCLQWLSLRPWLPGVCHSPRLLWGVHACLQRWPPRLRWPATAARFTTAACKI